VPAHRRGDGRAAAPPCGPRRRPCRQFGAASAASVFVSYNNSSIVPTLTELYTGVGRGARSVARCKHT